MEFLSVKNPEKMMMDMCLRLVDIMVISLALGRVYGVVAKALAHLLGFASMGSPYASERCYGFDRVSGWVSF